MKSEPREYTAFSHDGGIVLCDKQDGAFLVLRYAEDLERLKALLNTLTVQIGVHAEEAGK